MQAKKDGEDVDFDQFKIDKVEYARCATCLIPLEKFEGCNKVECIQCKHVTCWVCKKDITDQGYNHFNEVGDGVLGLVLGKGPCKLWMSEMSE